MSELPEVREYREAQLRRNQNWNEDAYVKIRLADAAIAALEAELAEKEDERRATHAAGHAWFLEQQKQFKRAEAAEAELEEEHQKRLNDGLSLSGQLHNAVLAKMAAEAENFGLRCVYRELTGKDWKWEVRDEDV